MAKDAPAEKMKRKDYEKELEKLQVELCHLQEWVKAEKVKIAAARPVRHRLQGRASADA
jgi:polyphosphate kinase 2 (PPK2 family)